MLLVLFPLVLDAPVRHHHDVVGLEFAGAGHVVGDPLFTGRAPLPYAPKALSPCINAGANVGWTSADIDLAGNRRRSGPAVDIGCYEYCNTGLQIILQ